MRPAFTATMKISGQISLCPVLYWGLGGSDVDFSQISGGMAGIDYWGTDYDGESGEISVQLSCRLLPALRVFNIGTVPLTVSMRSRAFIGGKMLNESSDKKTVSGAGCFCGGKWCRLSYVQNVRIY